MTECERLIANGTFTRDFFKDELRDGFLVTTAMKKIWAIELDLLLQLDNVCKKFGMQYFLIDGSLIGAVRHKGFIPWDDDIDVAMMRSDYERFLALAPEFKSPYFLQHPTTDAGYFYSFIKIRNSNTTSVSKCFQYQPFNHGIGLDVFPIDRWDLEGGEERFARIRQLNYDNSTAMRASNPLLDEANRLRVAKLGVANPMETFNEMERLAKSCSCSDSPFLSFATSAIRTSYRQRIMVADDFSRAVSMKFEGYDFPCPNGYDRFLRMTYGDYMKFPPVEARKTVHGGSVNDPDTPYKEFLEKNLDDHGQCVRNDRKIGG